MKEFSSFIMEGKVIKQSPDPFEARSLLAQSKARLEDLDRLPLDEKSASFRFESAYDEAKEIIHFAKRTVAYLEERFSKKLN